MGKTIEYIRNLFRGKKKTSGEKDTWSTGIVREGSFPLWLSSASPALCVSTAYRCIDFLSKSVANLPVVCKRKTGEIFIEDTRGNLPYLLNVEPDAAINAFDFWRQAVIEVLCSGNAYIVPFYDAAGGDWNRLVLCSRGSVNHDTTTDTYSISDIENGVNGVYSEDQVIHLKGMPGRDPKNGLSVLTYARLTMATASAGDKEVLERFDSGGVKGMLSIKNTGQGGNPFLQDNTKESFNVARNLDRQLQERNIAAMPGEYAFQQFGMTSADMQFLESRKFTVREICRFFGLHPSFVFDDTSNNYKSAEMANVAFLSNTLNPMLRQIENEMLRKLYPPRLAMKRKIEFDRQGIYACDLDSKVKYYNSMISAGLYTVNEVRALEGRQPVEGGDKVLVSANLKDIEDLTSGQTQEKDPEGKEPEENDVNNGEE